MNFLEAPGSPGAHSMNASVLRHLPVAAATLAAVSALLLSGCSSVPLENAPIVNRNASSGETMAPVTTGSTASHALVGGVEDSGRTHVVAPGDTIYNISQRYGLDASALMQLNAVRDPTTLRLAQTLHLPVSVREGSTAIAPGVRVHRVETADAFASESSSPSSASSISSASGAPISSATALPAAGAAAAASEKISEASAKASEAVESAKSAVAEKVEQAEAVIPGTRLIWPVRGKVLSDYAKNGKGLDIESSVGSIVVAAGAGEVLFVGDNVSGYGQLVIIKHTPTMVTAYGHNSKIVVQPRDKVRSGQKIAEVGKDDKGRAVLRFEVRDKGRAVDPMKFLPAAR
mgnify:CR=1 FL=1